MRYVKLIFKNEATAVGTAMILCGLSFLLPTIATFKGELVALKGSPRTSKNVLEDVYASSRLGHKPKSKRNTLEFTLNGHDRVFVIRKNLGDFTGSHLKAPFYKIDRKLKTADSATVWIKKREQDRYSPKIFQLDINDKTVIEFDEVRYEYLLLFILALALGTCLLWLGLRFGG